MHAFRKSLLRYRMGPVMTSTPLLPSTSHKMHMLAWWSRTTWMRKQTGWHLHWRSSPQSIRRSMRALSPRFVVINLGNLTSTLLNKVMMECLMWLCEQHNLVLLTDEVYQSNLHMHDTPVHIVQKSHLRLGSSVLHPSLLLTFSVEYLSYCPWPVCIQKALLGLIKREFPLSLSHMSVPILVGRWLPASYPFSCVCISSQMQVSSWVPGVHSGVNA